jgi:hypothetical protein
MVGVRLFFILFKDQNLKKENVEGGTKSFMMKMFLCARGSNSFDWFTMQQSYLFPAKSCADWQDIYATAEGRPAKAGIPARAETPTIVLPLARNTNINSKVANRTIFRRKFAKNLLERRKIREKDRKRVKVACFSLIDFSQSDS